MVARLFVLLIAMLLVAVPVDPACDEPCSDVTAAIAVSAELAVSYDLICSRAVVAPLDCRVTPVAARPDTAAVPPTPTLAGIFRPPRPAFAEAMQAIA